MHGIMDSSDAWVIGKGDSNPAMITADAGYDVWLGNMRGQVHSNKHMHLDRNKDKKSFYDYDIATISKLDLPTMIEFIRA